MKTPPQAFLIFREELKKAELEKKRLQAQYEEKITGMNKELDFLKEQIFSQQQMMKTTVEYATKLESELAAMRKQLQQDKNDLRKSFH